MNRTLIAACLGATLSAACGGSGSQPKRGSGEAPTTGTAGPLDACALLTDADVAAIVGNAVAKGQHFAGSEVCKWDAEPGNTTVLLTVRPAGSLREQSLCPELKKRSEGQRLEGLADVAIWKFSSAAGLFNSGEFETCGSKGYISVGLNGKQDDATLKQQSESIVRSVMKKL